VVHGQEDDGHFQAILPEFFKRLDAVEQGHADVGDDRIGTQRASRFDHFSSILDYADQLEVAGEDAFESFHHDPVIVGEQDSGACHAASCMGTQATTEVP
jgi:hypothetical protein